MRSSGGFPTASEPSTARERHTGAASDDDDLLGIEVHSETLLLIILGDSCLAISAFARQEELWPWRRHLAPRMSTLNWHQSAARRGEPSSPQRCFTRVSSGGAPLPTADTQCPVDHAVSSVASRHQPRSPSYPLQPSKSARPHPDDQTPVSGKTSISAFITLLK
jgi:hypothetical protein